MGNDGIVPLKNHRMPLMFRMLPKYLTMMTGTITEGTPGRSIRNGFCTICGRGTLFISPKIEESRNTGYCLHCGGSTRKRHVAFELLTTFSGGQSIRYWLPGPGFKMLNTAWDDQFTFFLSKHDWYNFSEYFPDLPSGKEVMRRGFSLDLQDTKLSDCSLDLVVSEDVFEHVRDHRKGFTEVHRILKKGGYHIFTVPYMPDKRTIDLVDTTGPNDVFLTEPEYHYGGRAVRDGSFDVKASLEQRRVLAYRIFGYDIMELLDRIGFETRVSSSISVDEKLGIESSFVLVSRKT